MSAEILVTFEKKKKLLVAKNKDLYTNGLWFITFPYKPRGRVFSHLLPKLVTSRYLALEKTCEWFDLGKARVTGVRCKKHIRCVASSMGWSKNWGKDLDLHIVFVAFKLKNQFNRLLSEFQEKRCCFFKGVSKGKTFSAPNSLDWLDIWTFGPCFLVIFFDVYFEI